MAEQDDLAAGFAAVVGALDPAMVIVTARIGTGARARTSGCLVGFATQCSIDPPRFLVCISRDNHTFVVAAAATHLAVHLLAEDQLDLARTFGEETGDEVDKFARVDWHVGPHGTAWLDACPVGFVGEVLDRVDLGDHVGHVLAPVAVDGPDGARPTARAGWLHLDDTTHLDPGHPR